MWYTLTEEDGPLSPTRIVCAIDLSEVSRPAMRFAANLAARYGASLLLLHVHQEDAETVLFEGPAVAERHAPVEALQQWSAEAAALGAERQEPWMLRGDPATEILRVAREEGADLIVMGTHGRSPLLRSLLGSVTYKVVRKAPCSVLTVRAA